MSFNIFEEKRAERRALSTVASVTSLDNEIKPLEVTNEPLSLEIFTSKIDIVVSQETKHRATRNWIAIWNT